MKKIYLLIGAGAIVVSANAQKSVAWTKQLGPLPTQSSSRVVTDTLLGNWEFGGSPSLNGSVGGGYVVGNNGYGDLQKAQAFVNLSPLVIEGALVWFGAKERDLAGGAASKVQVRLHNMNGTGTSVAGPGSPAPGTILSTVDLPFNDIDTALTMEEGLNNITFPSPVTVTSDFAIGINLETLEAGDTVGIVHSSDGDAGGTDLAWEQWDNGAWNSLYYAWPLDIDLFVWVTVDMVASNVNEMSFINGAKLYQNQPNPSNGVTNISYELEKGAKNVSVRIFDATGKLVNTFNEGDKTAGKYNISFNTSNLEAGVYYYALTAGDGRIAQKMIIE